MEVIQNTIFKIKQNYMLTYSLNNKKINLAFCLNKNEIMIILLMINLEIRDIN